MQPSNRRHLKYIDFEQKLILTKFGANENLILKYVFIIPLFIYWLNIFNCSVYIEYVVTFENPRVFDENNPIYCENYVNETKSWLIYILTKLSYILLNQ